MFAYIGGSQLVAHLTPLLQQIEAVLRQLESRFGWAPIIEAGK